MFVDILNIFIFDLSGPDDDKICNKLYKNGDLVSAFIFSLEINIKSLAGKYLLSTNVSDITIIDLTDLDDDEIFSRLEKIINSIFTILFSLKINFKNSLLIIILYTSAKSLVLE